LFCFLGLAALAVYRTAEKVRCIATLTADLQAERNQVQHEIKDLKQQNEELRHEMKSLWLAKDRTARNPILPKFKLRHYREVESS
jgi:hypothetical protein